MDHPGGAEIKTTNPDEDSTPTGVRTNPDRSKIANDVRPGSEAPTKGEEPLLSEMDGYIVSKDYKPKLLSDPTLGKISKTLCSILRWRAREIGLEIQEDEYVDVREYSTVDSFPPQGWMI